MRIKTSTSLLISSLVLVALTPLALAQPKEKRYPLPVEVALSASSIGQPIALSPDGQWVSYSVQDNRKRPGPSEMASVSYSKSGFFLTWIGHNVWVTNTKTGESRNLTDGKGNAWGPVWSPNGQYLAFYSDQTGETRLWVWEKSTGKIRQVSEVSLQFGYNLVQWTPDSRKVLARILPAGMTFEDAANLVAGTKKPGSDQATDTQVTAVIYSSEAISKLTDLVRQQSDAPQPDAGNLNFTDLALIDVSNGKEQRVAQKIFPQRYWVSPIASHIAFTNWKGLEKNTQQPLYDLIIVSLQDGQARTAASNIPLGFDGDSVSWSPDGSLLSYVTMGQKAKGDCFIVPVKGGAPRNLTTAPHPNFGIDFSQRTPLWDAAGEFIYLLSDDALWKVSVAEGTTVRVVTIPSHRLTNIVAPAGGGRFWSPDGGRSVYVSALNKDTKQVGFYKVDIATGKYSKLIEENKKYGATARSVDVSTGGRHIVYVGQDAQHCEDVWITDHDFRQPRKLTRINPKLDDYQMGASRLIDWKSIDGQNLQGALLLPANYEERKRYPLIAMVYSGPMSDQVNRFGLYQSDGPDNMQLLATRGYAVLLPDAPIRVGTPMQDLAKTIIPGVNKVLEMGFADPDRIGLMGQSYGGYITIALLVQTARFKAAVMRAGFGNLISFYGVMDKAGSSSWLGYLEAGQGSMGGTPWQYRDRYIENSPIFYLDRVQTPLLIIHGTLDNGVPISATDEVFVGLRRLGKEVVYAKYEGEGHWEGNWGHANQVDYFNRMIGWFDKHLKAPETVPKTAEGPAKQ
jgi:dipeptidyl aminopeptidase/acylaminoacyl peptidase